jgi:hypothetical protein
VYICSMKTKLETWIENYNNKRISGKVEGKVVKLKDVPYGSPIHLITKKNTLYVYPNGYVKDFETMDEGQVYNTNSLIGKMIDENTNVFLCE